MSFSTRGTLPITKARARDAAHLVVGKTVAVSASLPAHTENEQP